MSGYNGRSHGFQTEGLEMCLSKETFLGKRRLISARKCKREKVKEGECISIYRFTP